MKQLLKFPSRFHLILGVLFSLLLFSSCEKDDDEGSPCDATKAEQISLRFEPNVNVYYADGTQYGFYNVELDIYKSYCIGDISGVFSNETETNSDGRAIFYYNYFYDVANTEDKVYYTYTIKQGATGWTTMPEGYENFTLTSEGQLIYQYKGEISYQWVSENAQSNEIGSISVFNKGSLVLPWNLEDVYFE